MEWVLIIYLFAGFGGDKTPVLIQGAKAYQDEESCHEVASQLVTWLTQDGVHVKYQCTLKPKVVGGVQ